MPTLCFLKGPGSGTTVSVDSGEVLEIGRKSAAPGGCETDVLVVDDPRVSRRHCSIGETEGAWVLRDCGSSNGTFVNGVRVTERLLEDGDRIQVGETLLRWGADADAPAVSGPEPAVRPPASSASGRRAAAVAAALLALGVAVLVLVPGILSPRREDRAASGVVPSSRSPPPAPAARPSLSARPRRAAPASGETEPASRQGGAAAPGPAAPAGDLPAAPAAEPELPVEVRRRISGGDYRGALSLLQEAAAKDRAGDLTALRRSVLEAASSHVALRREEVERLCRAGDMEEARAAVLDLLVRIPPELSGEVRAVQDLVRAADAEAMAKAQAARDAPDAEVEDLLAEVASVYRDLQARGAGDPGAWQRFCLRLEDLVKKHGGEPAYARRRRAVRDMYVAARGKVLAAERRRTAFHAAAVAWKEDLVTLRYEFAAPAELRDFRSVGQGSEAVREGSSLRLRGECRMLSGDPFHDRLKVRVTLRAGGYDPRAPNFCVALFSGEGDRLGTGGKVRSLLRPAVAGPGAPPDDVVVFALGYRNAVAEYAGQPLEEIRVCGRPEPVPFPAHLLLAVRHGERLHSDPRECLWAAAPQRALRGTLRLEVALEDGDPSWIVGTRPLLRPGQGSFERLGARRGRQGSVTFIAVRDSVRIRRIEIEGRVRRRWLLPDPEGTARREFQALDPLAR